MSSGFLGGLVWKTSPTLKKRVIGTVRQIAMYALLYKLFSILSFGRISIGSLQQRCKFCWKSLCESEKNFAIRRSESYFFSKSDKKSPIGPNSNVKILLVAKVTVEDNRQLRKNPELLISSVYTLNYNL